MKTKQELEKMVFYCDLTGLRTSVALKEDFGLADLKGYHFIYISLNDYELINEIYGYDAGEDLLKSVASQILYLGDYTKTYRVGGDEFLVVTNNLLPTDMDLLASKFRDPFMHGEASCTVHASFGVLAYDDFSGHTLDEIIKFTRFTMQQGKKQGKNTVMYATTELISAYNDKKEIETNICCANKNHEFNPHFRPFVDTFTGEVVGFETLARWYHKGKVYKPEQFLEIAKYTGKIFDIDVEMFEHTVRLISELRETHKLPRGFKGLSNFSCYTLERIKFDDLVGILNKYNVRAKDIIIEVLEDCFNDELAFENINELSRRGFYIAIGDFSANNSSIYQLPQLHVNIIKMSKKLLHSVNTDKEYTRVLNVYKFIVDLAEKLHIRVVAEGVDSKKSVKLLKDLNVHIGIGPLYTRAIPEAQFKEYLNK